MLDSSAVVAVISTVFGFVDLSLTVALPLSENVLTLHHYASIYGALLFSVSPVRCTCIIKYGAVRKFFQNLSNF